MRAPPANASSLPSGSDVRATRLTGRSLSRRLAPVMISTAALIVSVLAFLNQRSVDERAVIANQKADAGQVTYWILSAGGNPRHETLFVQNRGTAPISGVTLDLPTVDPRTEATVSARAGFGSIKSCTILKADLSSMIVEVSKSYIQFTDATGLTWVRTSWGQLNMVPTPYDNAPPDHALMKQRQFLRVKSCL